MEHKKRILTADLLIADVITDVGEQENGELIKLIHAFDLKAGGKQAIDYAAFERFSKAMNGRPQKVVAGGSSANTMATLKQLCGHRLEVDFIGVAAAKGYGEMIQQNLSQNGICLLPRELPPEPPAEPAISFVMNLPRTKENPSGNRTLVTYAGNARQLLNCRSVREEWVQNSDIVFLQGSLWQKFDWDFANQLTRWRWEHNKELWLALPTHSKFGEENAGLFQYLIPSSNLIMGNEEELARIFKTDSLEYKVGKLLDAMPFNQEQHNQLWEAAQAVNNVLGLHAEKAITCQQADDRNEFAKKMIVGIQNHDFSKPDRFNEFLAEVQKPEVGLSDNNPLKSYNSLKTGNIYVQAVHDLQKMMRDHPVLEKAGRLKRPQVAFITRGEKGAYLIYADKIIEIPPATIGQNEIKTTHGAGDTSFAGFAYGYLHGLDDEVSAKIAMNLAAEKLKTNGSRLENPRETLKRVMPNTALLLGGNPPQSGAVYSPSR